MRILRYEPRVDNAVMLPFGNLADKLCVNREIVVM